MQQTGLPLNIAHDPANPFTEECVLRGREAELAFRFDRVRFEARRNTPRPDSVVGGAVRSLRTLRFSGYTIELIAAIPVRRGRLKLRGTVAKLGSSSFRTDYGRAIETTLLAALLILSERVRCC
jgi:hypothetical protein